MALDFASAVVAALSPSLGSLLHVSFQVLPAVVAAALYRLLRPEGYTEECARGPKGPKLLAEVLGAYEPVLTVSLSFMTKSKGGPRSSLAASCA